MPDEVEVLPTEWVTEEIIRHQFNESQLYEKAVSGEIVVHIKRSSHPDTPPQGEPVCTWSQIAYYYDKNGKPLAVVHQYRRVDGSIGASGKPDPKRIFLADKSLAVRNVRKIEKQE